MEHLPQYGRNVKLKLFTLKLLLRWYRKRVLNCSQPLIWKQETLDKLSALEYSIKHFRI